MHRAALTAALVSPLRPASRGGTPPGPRPDYPGQFVVELVRDPIGLLERVAAYGDVAQIKIGPQRLVVVRHPDEIRRVLVTDQRSYTKGRGLERSKLLLGSGLLTSEGEAHLRQRRLVQPAFHRDRIAQYGRVMVDYAREATAQWRSGQVVDLYQEMMRLTLRIAGRTLFDTEMADTADEVTSTIALSLQAFRYAILPFGHLVERIPLPWLRRLRRGRVRMNDILYGMIAERRASGTDRGDLLSMLLLATDADGDGAGLSDQQVRDEVITLLAAGHETTAVALTWTWYLLSQHPAVERELQAELDTVLGERAPTVADLDQLVYTRWVFTEAMRLYPPAWVIERRAVRDVTLGGYQIPAGALVLVSQYLAHRDRRWYGDPSSFEPHRWAPGAERERPKFAYFPFGAGTRACIGEAFAWMEGTLLLATIARGWQMRHDIAHEVGLEPLITLRPRHGMRMVLRARGSPLT
ncbi:MAG TPA: cytochrome P450 [Gemmatimonadaceae bacterium]|jgi:cytochrome P450|nr:cytochrome P450 [Gemmatimonadaceae bacterium]